MEAFLEERLRPARDRVRIRQGGRVLDYLNESASSIFYDNLFAKQRAFSKPELYDVVKKPQGDAEYVEPQWRQIVSKLKAMLAPDAFVVELGGGVHQRRSGFLYRYFPHYVPLDISLSSIEQYAQTYQRTGVVCDATTLPFRDASVDCVVTRTFLEHPLQPEKVLEEIARVLKPGGLVLHDDAWFCRWWSRFGVVGLKRFSNMTFKEKCIDLAAKVTEFPAIRIPPVVLSRLVKEVLIKPRSTSRLPYKKLRPNYDLLLGCDEDAASSIDPLDVIRFYEGRGFRSVESFSLLKRLTLRNRYVLMEKQAKEEGRISSAE